MSANTARTVAAARAERRLCRDESTACIVYETIKRMVRAQISVVLWLCVNAMRYGGRQRRRPIIHQALTQSHRTTEN